MKFKDGITLLHTVVNTISKYNNQTTSFARMVTESHLNMKTFIRYFNKAKELHLIKEIMVEQRRTGFRLKPKSEKRYLITEKGIEFIKICENSQELLKW